MSETPRHPFEARLGRWPSERLEKILVKRVRRMLELFPAQIEMDMAHTVMLVEQGVLTADEGARILGVLAEIQAMGPERFPVDRKRSTLFWSIEAHLIRRLGETLGGKMHTGRSHNDILPTISRMGARDATLRLMTTLAGCQGAVLALADRHVETVMPGYTSLQHSQPWTFGHYLAGWFYAFERDFTRLRHAYENVNQSPLGACALAGTSWPLNRLRTAELLGFDGIMLHSRDAGFGTKDYVAEVLAAVAILMSDLAALSSDLYVWSSYEFGMIELADEYCGTSSIMPQKKNAWAVDWARGAAGNALGHLASCLGALKGATSTDGAAQDYPETPLAEGMETATDYVDLLTGVLETLKVNAGVMLERAAANWTTASNLADAIVRHSGLSFRAAHGVVATLVRAAIREGRAPGDVDGAMVDRAAEEAAGTTLGLDDAVVREALDPVQFVRSRVTAGSVNPEETRSMLEDGRRRLAAERRWLDERHAKVAGARSMLRAEVERRAAPE